MGCVLGQKEVVAAKNSAPTPWIVNYVRLVLEKLLAPPTEITLDDISSNGYMQITWWLLMQEYFVDVQNFSIF